MGNSCERPGLQPVSEALQTLLDAVQPVTDTESVTLTAARGRVLAEAVTSAVDVPPLDNSAVDGYAVASADLASGRECRLPMSQRIAAGQVGAPLQPGTAARIFTGAPLPPGADAVVMQEDTETDGNTVLIKVAVTSGMNVRSRGQDLSKGGVALPAGRRLRPQDMGLLASAGVGEVTVWRRLKVAIASTGDELVEPGQQAGPGQIYNSNRYTLLGMLASLGVEVIDLGIIEDTPEATERALLQAADEADCIITSGGVSVGEEDHVKDAVERLGRLELWKLAIKPGKPLAFGQVKDTPFIGLPGNPAAVFVTFSVLARPFLLKALGASEWLTKGWPLKTGFDYHNRGARQEYLRCRLLADEAGGWVIDKYPNQSSGVLASASWGDGFAVVPPGMQVRAGELLEFISYNELGF